MLGCVCQSMDVLKLVSHRSDRSVGKLNISQEKRELLCRKLTSENEPK